MLDQGSLVGAGAAQETPWICKHWLPPATCKLLCCKDFLFMSIPINYPWINSNEVVTMLRARRRNSPEGQAQF